MEEEKKSGSGFLGDCVSCHYLSAKKAIIQDVVRFVRGTQRLWKMLSIASDYLRARVLGSIFGFQGSVSPDPLLTIIISETLANGIRSSWRAAVIPLCTDPIALCIAIFIVANVPNAVLATIAF